MRRRRAAEREDERDEEQPGSEEEQRPLDSGTIQALRDADPQARAQTLLQLQRLHGNAAVQRVIRSLQVTDASRDARVQAIGDKAEEPAPSGKLDKAQLYREAVEGELDAAPLAAKSERDIVQDSVNTIGQIFTNYQAALHLFEDAVEKGAGEAVPRELAKEVLREAARDVFEPVMAAAAKTAADVGDHVAEGLGVADEAPAEQPKQPGASAPAYALKNLIVAERRRIAATQVRLLKAQVHFFAVAEDRAARYGTDYREQLAAANGDLNDMESSSHSPERIFKRLMERFADAARSRADVRIAIDSDWRVVRAHIKGPRSGKLASQLLQDHSGWFDLNELKLLRHVTWEPAELAVCEALVDGRGVPRQWNRNEKAGRFFDEFQERLRNEGLPRTNVLTGD